MYEEGGISAGAIVGPTWKRPLSFPDPIVLKLTYPPTPPPPPPPSHLSSGQASYQKITNYNIQYVFRNTDLEEEKK